MKQKITQSPKASTLQPTWYHHRPSPYKPHPIPPPQSRPRKPKNQTKPQGLNYSLNQVRLCTTRLDDGITNMERYVFSRKSAITAIHKPHQPSKPLPMNNQTFSLPIVPPPPIQTNQTNIQTQNETPLDIPSQPLCTNISPKGPDFVAQTQPLSQSLSLRTTQDFPTTKHNHKAETQTRPQSSKFLTHPIQSTPKVPQISTIPIFSCPPISHHTITHPKSTISNIHKTIKKTATPTADLQLFAATVPPPIPVKCQPLSIFCHRVPDPIHSYYVAKDPDEDSRNSYFVWLTGKEQGRIFSCLIHKAKTRGRELAGKEKRTEIFYDWFGKRKKKRIKWSKRKSKPFSWSKRKEVVQDDQTKKKIKKDKVAAHISSLRQKQKKRLLGFRKLFN